MGTPTTWTQWQLRLTETLLRRQGPKEYLVWSDEGHSARYAQVVRQDDGSSRIECRDPRDYGLHPAQVEEHRDALLAQGWQPHLPGDAHTNLWQELPAGSEAGVAHRMVDALRTLGADPAGGWDVRTGQLGAR